MWLVHALAICDTCGWTCNAKNAMGAGAIHFQKHQHVVRVEVTYAHRYGNPSQETPPLLAAMQRRRKRA